MKIILFGAGNNGINALRIFGNMVECFADNDIHKQGKIIEGKIVVSFEQMKQMLYKNNKLRVLITVEEGRMQIEEQFKRENIPYSKYHVLTRPLNEVKELVVQYNEKKFYGQGDIEYIQMIFELLQINDIEIQPFDRESCYQNGVIVVCDDNYFERLPELQSKCKKGMISILRSKGVFYDKDVFFVEHREPVKDEKVIREIINNSNEIVRQDAYVRNALKYPVGRPVNISIETVNICNGHCSFCPASVENNKRTLEYMEEDLFKKIIDELGGMDYRGELALYTNNEPLIDKRIVNFAKYARENVKYADIRLSTNGRLLTVGIFKELNKYLDTLVIQNYSNTGTMYDNIKEIYDYCNENPSYKEKTKIVLRNENEILSTRGGLASNRNEMDDYSEHSCTQPFMSMYIQQNGNCCICCADVYGDIVLGNVAETSVLDVWNSKKYEEIRKRIAGGRKNIKKCKNCDQFVFYKI